MEISHNPIHQLELIARINKNPGPARFTADFSYPISSRLQSTDRGSTYRNNPFACSLGSQNQIRHLLANAVILLVHNMVLNILHIYRTEGTQSHMEGDKAKIYTIVFQLLQLFLGKMQTSRRGSSRALLLGIYRLIPLLVCQLFVNIWRQRCFSQSIQNFLKDTLILEFYNTPAKIRMVRNSAGQFITKSDNLPNLSLPAWLHQGFPGIPINTPQQENLHLATGTIPPAQQSSWHNSGIIHNQGIPRL